LIIEEVTAFENVRLYLQRVSIRLNNFCVCR